MRHLSASTFTSTVIAGTLAVTGAGAAPLPAATPVAAVAWRNPDLLPALPGHPHIHYEPGGVACAQAVAALLPDALARVASVHGRPFARPVGIGAYVSWEAFAAGNGLGQPRAAGVTYGGRVTLAPLLFTTQRQRLRGILTHELSHAHLQGWIPASAWVRLPNWFKEGLAVMISEGGGAEFVTAAAARDALRRGDRIVVDSEGSARQPTGIGFENPAPVDGLRVMMGYRQAGLFVAFLHDRDAAGFARMMAAVLDGRRLADAVAAGYGSDVAALWADFLRGNDQPG